VPRLPATQEKRRRAQFEQGDPPIPEQVRFDVEWMASMASHKYTLPEMSRSTIQHKLLATKTPLKVLDPAKAAYPVHHL